MITTRPAPPIPAPPIPAGLDTLMQLVAFAQACLGPDLAGILADLDARQKAAEDTLAQAQAERAAAKHAQDSALEATNLAAARVAEAEQKVLAAKAIQVDAEAKLAAAAEQDAVLVAQRKALAEREAGILAREATSEANRKAVELGLATRSAALAEREKQLDQKSVLLDEKIAEAIAAKETHAAKTAALKSALEG